MTMLQCAEALPEGDAIAHGLFPVALYGGCKLIAPDRCWSLELSPDGLCIGIASSRLSTVCLIYNGQTCALALKLVGSQSALAVTVRL